MTRATLTRAGGQLRAILWGATTADGETLADWLRQHGARPVYVQSDAGCVAVTAWCGETLDERVEAGLRRRDVEVARETL